MDLNALIVVVYFAFLLTIGWMFKSMTTNTSDYFRGGGNVLWWMVGACAFMTQISAWTFTGAASKAYSDGFGVMLLFVGNALGFFFNYLYFAPRFRQMRVVTVVDALRLRFGSKNEQVFAWINMITTVIHAGIGINALAIIASSLFGFSTATTIIATGIVIVALSATGGSWAAIAADFFQMIIVMVVTVSCAAVGIYLAGGVTPIIERFPTNFVTGPANNYMSIFYIWGFSIFLKQIGLTNNILYSYRYLTAKDSIHARKGALLALVFAILCPVMWFIPPWFMASSGVDLHAMYPAQANYSETAYLAFVKLYMPAGMIGLLVAAMFSATMSGIDTGLNRNAGIFVNNFIRPLILPSISTRRLMIVSRTVSVGFGALIVSLALFLNSLQNLSLFDAVLYSSALLGFPQMIPGFLGFFIRKTPDWGAWATILVGAGVSFVTGGLLKPQHIESLLSLSTPFTPREWSDLVVAITLLSHVVITGGFFCLTTLFYKGLPEAREEAVSRFFTNKNTPLIKRPGEHVRLDNHQRVLVGRTVAVAGVLVMALMALPNPLWGRFVFLVCGGGVLGLGAMLTLSTEEVPAGVDSERAEADDGADLIAQA